MNNVENILHALRELRIPPQPEEYEIHDMIALTLTSAGIAFEHEYRLSSKSRIDFFCDGIGIEVKKSRPDALRLRAQLERYLESPRLDCVIVVMQRPCRLPAQLCGKPVFTLALNRLWGVALP